VYEGVEMPLLRVLAAAQARGLPVRGAAAAAQLRGAEAAAAAARRAACAAARLTIDFADRRSREAALDAAGVGLLVAPSGGDGGAAVARRPRNLRVRRRGLQTASRHGRALDCRTYAVAPRAMFAGSGGLASGDPFARRALRMTSPSNPLAWGSGGAGARCRRQAGRTPWLRLRARTATACPPRLHGIVMMLLIHLVR